MTLSIILTSYNRPFFLKRAIDSILAQTCADWRLIILDDNSNHETRQVLAQYRDPRIDIRYHDTTDAERKTSSRYAVLINSVLPELTGGVVGYLCDNVEYYPQLVESVLRRFEECDAFAVYAVQRRDVWTADGNLRGTAAQFGHWDYMPGEYDKGYAYSGNLYGVFDHSQVFHRLPVALRWNEGIDTVKYGDAEFYTRMVEQHGMIYPIHDQPLTWEHIIE